MGSLPDATKAETSYLLIFFFRIYFYKGGKKNFPTSSTVTALRIPPALSKAQGKLSSPAPRADFNMMKMAPMDPSLGSAVASSGGLVMAEASRLMLSLANSSILPPVGHTDTAAVLCGAGPLAGQGEADWGGGLGLIEGCCCCLQALLGNTLLATTNGHLQHDVFHHDLMRQRKKKILPRQ